MFFCFRPCLRFGCELCLKLSNPRPLVLNDCCEIFNLSVPDCEYVPRVRLSLMRLIETDLEFGEFLAQGRGLMSEPLTASIAVIPGSHSVRTCSHGEGPKCALGIAVFEEPRGEGPHEVVAVTDDSRKRQ